MTLIAPHRSGFKSGTNSYVETQGKTGMDFDIFVASENENLELKDDEKEIAIVVIEGKGEIEFQECFTLERKLEPGVGPV